MAIEQDGETFLSTAEAKASLGVSSDVTFRGLREKHSIKSYNVLGQRKTLFYKESDIKQIPRIQPAKEE